MLQTRGQANSYLENLKNQQRDHQSTIPVIEVNDRFSKDEIDDFISQEDIDDQILGNDIDTNITQFDFISNLPPFLKEQEGFSGIQHNLKQITRQVKLPSAKQARSFPTIEPVHCKNCFDWIERYYRDVPYLQ
jgi:arginine utilization protein RocB